MVDNENTSCITSDTRQKGLKKKIVIFTVAIVLVIAAIVSAIVIYRNSEGYLASKVYNLYNDTWDQFNNGSLEKAEELMREAEKTQKILKKKYPYSKYNKDFENLHGYLAPTLTIYHVFHDYPDSSLTEPIRRALYDLKDLK